MAKSRRTKGRATGEPLDRELTHLPAEVRWREWMNRVEAAIFAASEPLSRESLARVVGKDCKLDSLIADIRAELRGRPYDLVAVAGGWKHLTRPAYADAIRAVVGASVKDDLSKADVLVLMMVGYFQPVTRSELGRFFGREISRDQIGHLRRLDLIAAGPRSPQPGSPYTYVTTPGFLLRFGLDTLRDLPDFEALEDAGLLSKDKLLAGEIPMLAFGEEEAGGEPD
jgi:segregation and condensation protein B